MVLYLPPYSPELNLIEIVWKHAMYHWRRFVTWTNEPLMPRSLNFPLILARNFKLIFRERLNQNREPVKAGARLYVMFGAPNKIR
jgi:transposase